MTVARIRPRLTEVLHAVRNSGADEVDNLGPGHEACAPEKTREDHHCRAGRLICSDAATGIKLITSHKTVKTGPRILLDLVKLINAKKIFLRSAVLRIRINH
jgi:hypothetical protein